MLSDTVTAYIKLRHATGFKFAKSAGMLKSFAAFAEAQGDAVVLHALQELRADEKVRVVESLK